MIDPLVILLLTLMTIITLAALGTAIFLIVYVITKNLPDKKKVKRLVLRDLHGGKYVAGEYVQVNLSGGDYHVMYKDETKELRSLHVLGELRTGSYDGEDEFCAFIDGEKSSIPDGLVHVVELMTSGTLRDELAKVRDQLKERDLQLQVESSELAEERLQFITTFKAGVRGILRQIEMEIETAPQLLKAKLKKTRETWQKRFRLTDKDLDLPLLDRPNGDGSEVESKLEHPEFSKKEAKELVEEMMSIQGELGLKDGKKKIQDSSKETK